MENIQIEAIDDVINFIDEDGASHEGYIKDSLHQKWGDDISFVSQAISICQGFEFIIETSESVFGLTEKGTRVAQMGYDKYVLNRKEMQDLDDENRRKSAKYYKMTKRFMIITVIVAILSIAANLYIAFY